MDSDYTDQVSEISVEIQQLIRAREMGPYSKGTDSYALGTSFEEVSAMTRIPFCSFSVLLDVSLCVILSSSSISGSFVASVVVRLPASACAFDRADFVRLDSGSLSKSDIMSTIVQHFARECRSQAKNGV